MVVNIMRTWSLSQLPARGVRWMPVVQEISVLKSKTIWCLIVGIRWISSNARSRAVSSKPFGYVDRRD